MLHLLDIRDMNRKLALQRRHETALRALVVSAYCAAAIAAGLLAAYL